MKALWIGSGAVLLGLGVALAATNPGRDAYRDYAGDRLATYLQTDVCDDAGNFANVCESFVETSRPQLATIVDRGSERQNFLLFSLYHTDLSVPVPGVPQVRARSVGVFQQFYTYELTAE